MILTDDIDIDIQMKLDQLFSDVKANDVKNLDIGIPRNIPMCYGKKLIDHFGLEMVNDINRLR